MNPQAPLTAQFGAPLQGFGQINSMEQWAAFQKAMQTSGDPNLLDSKGGWTGVPAIRFESLEATLRSVVMKERHFTLFKRLKSKKTTSSVFEWSTKVDIGGDIGNNFHGETSDIRKGKGDFVRDVGRVKYLMDGAEITVVANLQRLAVESLKADENESATLRIMRSLEWALFQGNESVVAEEFNGIAATLEQVAPDHVIDLQASSDTEELYDAIKSSLRRTIGPDGGYGQATDVFLDPLVQQDLDNHLNPLYRLTLNQSNGPVQYGTPVEAIRTSFGKLALNPSLWIDNADYTHLTAPAVIRLKGRINEGAPAAPTFSATPATGAAGSKWKTAQAGTYYYAVAAVNQKGEGPLSAIQAATVAEGGKVTLAITPNGALGQTGFVVYRSTQDPSGTPQAKDLRKVCRIPNGDPADPSAVTTYVDLNANIPGESSLYVLDLLDEKSLDWTQLLPLTTFPLYPTVRASYPWALLLFGTLKVGIPQRHWRIKNYIPKEAAWQPFTVA